MILVRNSELLTTLGATGGQDATTILRGHSLTEAVLERSFHFALSFYCYYRYNALRERRGHSRYGLQNYGFFLK